MAERLEIEATGQARIVPTGPVREPEVVHVNCGDRTYAGGDDEASCELRAGHGGEWHEAEWWFDGSPRSGLDKSEEESRPVQVMLRWRRGHRCRTCGTSGLVEECVGTDRPGCLERRARRDAVNRGEV